MKFENNETEVVKIGDIQKNNVSIDTKNIDFIVNILATNLYSHPIASFIRETVSNAWDSHIEAGVDKPVTLEVKRNSEGNFFCRVQDFGVGLSPKRFDEIYRNIGSSTKRATNEQIGGFGIGRFAALAYTDIVYLTSNYEGTQYKYMMYKDIKSLNIDLIHTVPTTEENGLEVMIDVKSYDESNFYDAIEEQLVYFENLYVELENKTRQEKFNKFLVKKFKNFQVNTLLGNGEGRSLTLGKVRYPLRYENFSSSSTNKVSRYPISLTFDIGDLDITPNREELLYTESNLEKINAKVEAAYEEVEEYVESKLDVNYDILNEYLENVGRQQPIYFIKVDVSEGNPVYIERKAKKVSYRDIEYEASAMKDLYSYIKQRTYLPITHNLKSGKIYYKATTNNLSTIIGNFDMFCLADIPRLSNVAKEYLRDTYIDTFFISPDAIDIKEIIIHTLKVCIKATSSGYNRIDFDMKSFRVLVKYFLKGLKNMKTFEEKDIPKSWKDTRKLRLQEKKKNRTASTVDWKQNISIGELRRSGRSGITAAVNNRTYSLSDLNFFPAEYKKLVIYSYRGDEDFKSMYHYLSNHAKLIEVAPTKMKLLKDVNHFVKFEDFMEDIENRLIKNLATAQYIEEYYPQIIELHKIRNVGTISTKLKDIVEELYDFYDKYCLKSYFYSGNDNAKALVKELLNIVERENEFNQKIFAILKENKKLLTNGKVLTLFARNKNTYSSEKVIPAEMVNVAVDYILARKLFRPDYSAANKKYKETIYNIEVVEEDSIPELEDAPF